MRITRPLALALLLTSACASTPGGPRPQEAKKPVRGGIAEFHLTYYDGYHLRGRLLVGATEDPFVIDGRLIEDRHVELKKIHACGKPGEFGHFIVDVFGEPRPEDIITLHKGYWYGSNIDFFLWDDRETGIGPDCFDGEFVVFAMGGVTAATLPIRVERTHNPPTPPLGAPAKPIPSTLDGGIP